MALDLLSMIRGEIDERLSELRPLLAEHEQLLVAATALERTAKEDDPHATASTIAPPARPLGRARARSAKRGSAAGVIERAKSNGAGVPANGQVGSEHVVRPRAAETAQSATPAAEKSKPARAARGAAREAILAALDHGSHTIGELVVVTAMSGPNINGNLRRLLSEGAVVKTEREGKMAWALGGATV
jgi:hypothetical protein